MVDFGMKGQLVRFDYRDNCNATIVEILGGTLEFEDQVANANRHESVEEVTVHPMSPGLSGAAVFLVRRTGRNIRYSPWVVKVCSNPSLVISERENNRKYVQGKLGIAPLLIETGSSRILIFVFGGALADFDPCTLRSGYEAAQPKALAELMKLFVMSISRLHHHVEDGTSCVDRMPLLISLADRLRDLGKTVPEDLANRFLELWTATYTERRTFPRFSSTGHGDLNAGNLLFDPHYDVAYPIVIDFASMERSKDNQSYPLTQHLPFWDYAKLERDIQTRLFLKEALACGLGIEDILNAVRWVNGCGDGLEDRADDEAVSRFLEVTASLRNSVVSEYSPNDLQAYRVVLAYAMLTTILRAVPDGDVPHDLQIRLAVEASVCLLSAVHDRLPAEALRRGSPPIGQSAIGQVKPEPLRLARRLSQRTWERDATQDVSRQKTLLIVAIERVLERLQDGAVAIKDREDVRHDVTFVRNNRDLDACGRINAQAYSGNRWGGVGLTIEDNVLEKTERNRNHWEKCPKALLLLKATRVEGATPSKGYIGFTHLIPLNEVGFRRYCRGEIEDNVLGTDVIASPHERAEAILLFSMALDPMSIDRLYRRSEHRIGNRPNGFQRFRYHQFEKLIRALAYHAEEMAAEYHGGQSRVRVIVQADDSGEMIPAIRRAGFTKTGWVSGDRCPIWELMFAISDSGAS